MAAIVHAIRPGDRVTIVDRFGKKHTGRAVICERDHCVLNMGGRYGTPAVATDENIVGVKPTRGKNPRRVTTERSQPTGTNLFVLREMAWVIDHYPGCAITAMAATHKPHVRRLIDFGYLEDVATRGSRKMALVVSPAGRGALAEYDRTYPDLKQSYERSWSERPPTGWRCEPISGLSLNPAAMPWGGVASMWGRLGNPLGNSLATRGTPWSSS